MSDWTNWLDRKCSSCQVGAKHEWSVNNTFQRFKVWNKYFISAGFSSIFDNGMITEWMLTDRGLIRTFEHLSHQDLQTLFYCDDCLFQMIKDEKISNTRISNSCFKCRNIKSRPTYTRIVDKRNCEILRTVSDTIYYLCKSDLGDVKDFLYYSHNWSKEFN